MTTETINQTPAQRAAHKAVATMRARAAVLEDIDANFQDCAGCGEPTKVLGPRGRTYHADCAELAGVHQGRQAIWGLYR